MCDITVTFLECVQETNLKQKGYAPSRSHTAGTKEKEKGNGFTQAVSEIAQEIQTTTLALQQLAKSVKQQGLFDDQHEKISTLICRIKEDLSELNSRCDSVEAKYIASGDSTKQSSSHSQRVVVNLKSSLMNATKDFKSVLELRTSKMKDQQQRRAQLAGGAGFLALTPKKKEQNSFSSGMNNANNGMNAMTVANHTGNGMNANNGAVMSEQLLVSPPATSAYLASRAQAASEVERAIGELGQLFLRLNSLVEQQSEAVLRVDQDLECALDHTQRAREEMQRAHESASSMGPLYTKLIAVLVIFIIFFVVFLL